MFGHLFKYQLKTFLRNKVMIFWTLLFPIVLATLFNLAFSNIGTDEKFEPFPISVVGMQSSSLFPGFEETIEALSTAGDNQLFTLETVKTESDAITLLKENKIKAYLSITDDIKIIVKTSGIEQTILKYVVEDYYRMSSITENILVLDPDYIKKIADFVKTENHLEDKSNSNVDAAVVFFYTLIGMTCLYGGFFGIQAVKETEANLSKKAARFHVSPTHKLKVLLVSLLVGLIIQYTEMLILLFYIINILGIDFGNQLLPVLILALVGSFAGIGMGTLVGACNHRGENAKTAILLGVTMTCSFLAGMMSTNIKYMIQTTVPLLGKINPVTMITDGLYSLYYYDTLERYLLNIGSLLLFSAVMIISSYFFIRRKKYDSI